jgi:hypothetical protein
LSCREFSRREGINPNSLSWWKWKLGSEAMEQPGQVAATEAVGFVEVTGGISATGSDGVDVPRLVVVTGRYHVEVPVGFDRQTLAELLGVLGACS